MKLKFLKTALSGLILSISSLVNIANAGLIYSHSDELTFDGSQASVHSINYTPEFSLQAPFSLAATFTATSWTGNWVRVFGRGNSGPRNYGLWYHQNGNLLFQSYGAGGFNSMIIPGINLNQEYSMVGVLDGTSAKLYIDGVLVRDQGRADAPLNVDTQPLTIGGANFHSVHNGMISEVALWDHALSTDEVNSYAANGVSVPEPSTIAIFGLGVIGLAARRFKKQS